MKLFFVIYLLGCIISLVLTLLVLYKNKKKGENMINEFNDKISEKLDCYERVDFANVNTYCAINFLLSWVQVIAFIYSYLPSIFHIKIYFYKFVSVISIWIAIKSNAVANLAINRHNKLVIEHNKKNETKQD